MNDQQQNCNNASAVSSAYTIALLRSLKSADIEFLRYIAIDPYNTPRCKVVLIQRLLEDCLNDDDDDDNDGDDDDYNTLNNQVHIAQVCFGGLPSYEDVPAPNCGLTAQNMVRLQPDLYTLKPKLPYAQNSAMVLCDLVTTSNTTTSTSSSDLCCRSILKRVIERARNEYGWVFSIGIEIEFSLVDIESPHEPVDHTTFASTEILNRQQEFVSVLTRQLRDQDIKIQQIHAESAPGQFEIVLRHVKNNNKNRKKTSAAGGIIIDPVITMIDNLVFVKETISTVAYTHNLKAVFLPKMYPNQAGNGCHFHISCIDINNTGQNALASTTGDNDNQTCCIMSIKGKNFLEGILSHLPALLAVTIPTTNSFMRIGPGCWTGSTASWDVDDKEAPLRIITTHCASNKIINRIEYKLCDNTANPYLALAAILVSGLDGIQQQMKLRPPRSATSGRGGGAGGGSQPISDDGNLLPATIQESLDCLENDTVLMSNDDAFMPTQLSQAYLACRRAEAARCDKMTFQEQVDEAIERS